MTTRMRESPYFNWGYAIITFFSILWIDLIVVFSIFFSTGVFNAKVFVINLIIDAAASALVFGLLFLSKKDVKIENQTISVYSIRKLKCAVPIKSITKITYHKRNIVVWLLRLFLTSFIPLVIFFIGVLLDGTGGDFDVCGLLGNDYILELYYYDEKNLEKSESVYLSKGKSDKLQAALK